MLILKALLGHKVRLSQARSRPAATPATPNAPTRAGTVEAHRRIEFHSETERMSFQARGVVETADGRSIQFAANLTMYRELRLNTVTTESARTTDPLVVNYGGGPVRLTGAKIAFDLNADGTPETISFVAGGSGFLVLDKNGDGKVNDGGELFGPQSGSGFGELASYDADRNGWIDENDPVFTRLRIWTQDGLSTLWERGIGAISTYAAETPFALKDDAGVLHGDVRGTGIYLSENGAAGTIQEVDLAEG